MLSEFLESEPSAGQRLVLLCVFVAIGLVFSVQLSQTAAPEPLRWTRLTPETKYALPPDSPHSLLSMLPPSRLMGLTSVRKALTQS